MNDDEMVRLAKKYLKRKELKLMKYESLYFVREISKMPDSILQTLMVDIKEY